MGRVKRGKVEEDPSKKKGQRGKKYSAMFPHV